MDQTRSKRPAPNGAPLRDLPPLSDRAQPGSQAERVPTPDVPMSHEEPTPPAWVTKCSTFATKWKEMIASYAATHLIGYGDVIQVGSGTSFNFLMDKIIERQHSSREVLDLMIITTNLQALAKGREAQIKYPSVFRTMQMILSGGAWQASLDSLTGEYAARGVASDFIYPDTVFFGAAGLTFQGGLRISYHFEEEISTQVAYATRPTAHRVILCDHTKLGKNCGYKANLSIDSLLTATTRCTFISTLPEEEMDLLRVSQEEQHFLTLLRDLALREDLADKELALRLLKDDGTVVVAREHSLSYERKSMQDNRSYGIYDSLAVAAGGHRSGI